MPDTRVVNLKFRPLGLLSLLLLSTVNLFATDKFYDNYSESARLVIAGAYLAVGEHYSDLGEKESAEAFSKMADEIFPGVMSQEKNSQPAAPEAAAVTASAPARPSGKEPAAVQYYFGKMMRAVFSENTSDLASLLSTRLYLPGYDEGVKKDDVLNFVKNSFEKYPLDKTNPSLLYKLNRIYIKPEGSSWVAEIELTNQGAQIFENLGFEGTKQKFYFREYREGWRLIAINAE